MVKVPNKETPMTKSIAEKISRDVENTVDEVVHDLRSARKEVGARAEDTVVAISEFAADARDRAKALTKTAARTLRDRPVASVAIVASVATILGFLIGRISPRKA
jgi:ElaB/YqjD/DUF883 family membrane-anchored ribosome-binding protein